MPQQRGRAVAIDNDFAIWRALGNDAWPAKYLFDGQGKLVKRWVGEGRYDEIESELRRLLAAADPGVRLPAVSHEATVFARTGQPSYGGITGETYLGAERRQHGTVTLEGDWRSERQYVELRNGTGKIALPFTAGEVNLVVRPGPRAWPLLACCWTASRWAMSEVQTSARTAWRASMGPHDSPGRRCGATTARVDLGDERSGRAGVRIHCRTPEHRLE